MATRVSVSDTPARSITVSVMSLPEDMEMPKSPVSRPETQSTYCTGSGLSSPRRADSSATASSVAETPSATRAGSPGTARSKVKMTTLAAASSSPKRRMCLPMVRIISRPRSRAASR